VKTHERLYKPKFRSLNGSGDFILEEIGGF